MWLAPHPSTQAMLHQGTLWVMHPQSVSSLVPREALHLPSMWLRAGGGPLSPWQQSWFCHLLGGPLWWGRVPQARSKTEPPTTSCWRAARAGCHPVKLHSMQHQNQGDLEPLSLAAHTHACRDTPSMYTRTHTEAHKCTHRYGHSAASMAKFLSLSPHKNSEKGARSFLCFTKTA
jgi:hypothetical protein